VSVNFTVNGAYPLVGVAEKSATGAVIGGSTVIESICPWVEAYVQTATVLDPESVGVADRTVQSWIVCPWLLISQFPIEI
jgi:hypothetical protein